MESPGPDPDVAWVVNRLRGLARALETAGFDGDAEALAARLAEAHPPGAAGAEVVAREWAALLAAAEHSATADAVTRAEDQVAALLRETQQQTRAPAD